MSQIEVDKVIPQSGTALQVGDSGDTITIPAGATITNNGTANGFGSADTEKVKVSSNDTTAGFLNGKLVAGTNISLTEGSDGGNETLTAALTGTIGTSQIADDAVTLAKMAPGTDGNIISYDASGNPVAVATGSAGQVLTSAGAGAPPTFAAAAGGVNTPIFSAKVGSTQTVSNNSFTKIAFDTEEKDSDGAFDTSSYRFTVPSGKAGTYMLGMMMYNNPNNIQLVESYAMIYKNGSSLVANAIFYGSSARPDADVQVVNTVVDLAVGDYIEGYVYSLSSSGGSTRLFAGLNNAIFGYRLIV